MCTVTLVPQPGGYRLMMNRDELRHRAAALPPQTAPAGALTALFPRDPDGGGTWIGANSAGLGLALLNLNEGESAYALPGQTLRSRGGLIPALLAAPTLAQVRALFAAADRSRLRPFRLVATDGVSALTWHSRRRQWAQAAVGDGLLWTSSGLGDEQVEGPRRALWDRLRPQWGTPADRDRQAQFHRHQWPVEKQLSVCMARPDARTVSMTAIEVAPAAVRMAYHGKWPEPEVQTCALAREGA